MNKEGTHRQSLIYQKEINVALVGNPNTGKTTIINALAGMNWHVGNWPGVTVEKKSASFNFQGRTINIFDLPGIYSLSPHNEEELIVRNHLLFERPDVVINVIDAANLERNLYLTIQLLEMEIPMVTAINMMDEAKKLSLEIDISKLADYLGCPVFPIVAVRKEGLHDLLIGAIEKVNVPNIPKVSYDIEIEKSIRMIFDFFTHMKNPRLSHYPKFWLALKIIEGDVAVFRDLALSAQSAIVYSTTKNLRQIYGEDLESHLVDMRHGLVSSLSHTVLKKTKVSKKNLTGKIDAIALNRFWGPFFFLVIMWLIFKITFDLSSPISDGLERFFFGPLHNVVDFILSPIGASEWIISLIKDGIIDGTGSVLSFVPSIFTMMFFISFLEGTGYMARAAFLMDRLMHSIGLHGKSFIPFLLGFGCNVPAIYATKTLESKRDKTLTALLIPFMSCGARLPIYIVFTSTFFPHSAAYVLLSLYLLGIVSAILTGYALRKTLFRQDASLFVMELPPYRWPMLSILWRQTWERGKHFLFKAGTYIVIISIVIWFLLHFPNGIEQKKDSFLGQLGTFVSPIFAPLGFGTWETSVSLISGMVAKETVISTMAEIYGLSEDNKKGNESREVKNQLKRAFTPLSAYSFMIFSLLYIPCMVALFSIRQELGSWKWSFLSIIIHGCAGWIISLTIYQGGRILGIS